MKWLFLFVLIALTNGCTSYRLCDDCSSAYKYRAGLPGQIDGTTCRACGGHLTKCTEEESGWDEERYKNYGNEIHRRK